MDRFRADLNVTVQTNTPGDIAEYYASGEYENVIDLCEVNIADLSHDERAMYTFSCIELDRIKEAVTMLRIIANDVDDLYHEQAEYNLAYLLFKYGDPEALEILSGITKNRKHQYRKLAIELYNHPATNALKSKVAKKNLSPPENH